MSHGSRSLRSLRWLRARKQIQGHLRAWLRSALAAGLGLLAGYSSTTCIHAQDVNNSSTKNFQTNAIENSVGVYNNLSAGCSTLTARAVQRNGVPTC